MTSGDLGFLNETAQAVRSMKEKYMLWQQRLDSLIAQVPAQLPICTHLSHVQIVLSLYQHTLPPSQCTDVITIFTCWQLHGRAASLPV